MRHSQLVVVDSRRVADRLPVQQMLFDRSLVLPIERIATGAMPSRFVLPNVVDSDSRVVDEVPTLAVEDRPVASPMNDESEIVLLMMTDKSETAMPTTTVVDRMGIAYSMKLYVEQPSVLAIGSDRLSAAFDRIVDQLNESIHEVADWMPI
jgi:hypothetical protein